MKRLYSIYESLCQKCGRIIDTVLSVPIGKRITYGCKECGTPLIKITFEDITETYIVQYLQDTCGGLRDTRIYDL